MFTGAKTFDTSPVLQDKVQRHYARVVQAEERPVLTTTDFPAANQASPASANKAWQAALEDALARTNPLAEMQASILAREAELAERERMLAGRESALKARIPELEYFNRIRAA